MEIKKTTDYGIFKTIKGNRKVNPSHVKKIINSIREKNLLEQNPIIVNEKMEVIDGQHRLYAASELHKPIYYTIADDSDLRTVQIINANLRQWYNEDFLKSFIENGYEEYIKLDKFHKDHPFGLSICMGLLSGSIKRNDLPQIHENFINGDFKVKNYEEAENFITEIEKISKYLDGNFWKSIDFIRALELVFIEIDPDLLRQRLASSIIRLRKRPSIREYLRDLEEVCNYRQRKNVIRFLRTKKVE